MLLEAVRNSQSYSSQVASLHRATAIIVSPVWRSSVLPLTFTQVVLERGEQQFFSFIDGTFNNIYLYNSNFNE